MNEQEPQNHPAGSFIGIGSAIGVGVGTAVGVALGNIALGVGIGIGLGLTLGALWSLRQQRKHPAPPRPGTATWPACSRCCWASRSAQRRGMFAGIRQGTAMLRNRSSSAAWLHKGGNP